MTYPGNVNFEKTLSLFPKTPLDNLRPHALNYCSCKQKDKQELSTPSSPDTPPTSSRRPPADFSASSTTSSISPGETTLPPTATTGSGPPASSTIEDSAKLPRTGRRCRPQNQRNPIIPRITVQTPPPTRRVGSLQPARRVAKLEQKLDDTLGSPQTPADQGGEEPVLSEAQQSPEPVEGPPDQARRARPHTRRARLRTRPRTRGTVLRPGNHQLRSRARQNTRLHSRTRPRRHHHQGLPPHHRRPHDRRPCTRSRC